MDLDQLSTSSEPKLLAHCRSNGSTTVTAALSLTHERQHWCEEKYRDVVRDISNRRSRTLDVRRRLTLVNDVVSGQTGNEGSDNVGRLGKEVPQHPSEEFRRDRYSQRLAKVPRTVGSEMKGSGQTRLPSQDLTNSAKAQASVTDRLLVAWGLSSPQPMHAAATAFARSENRRVLREEAFEKSPS